MWNIPVTKKIKYLLIKKTMIKTILKILSPLRIEFLQPFFFNLYKLSLFFMNYGGWTDFRDSGEYNVLTFLRTKEKKLTIFDVWGNVWWYSLLCNQIFQVDMTTYTFEPSQTTYKKMVENIWEKWNIFPQNIGFWKIQEAY